MSNVYNSKKFSDAKDLFESGEYSYNGNLPRPSFWSLSRIGEQYRKDILDTGFYDPLVSYTSDLNDVVGDGTLLTYLKSHPELNIYIRSVRASFLDSGSSSGHPCRQANGFHIGNGEDCDETTENWSKDTKYLFQDAAGTPIPQEATVSPPLAGTHWHIPQISQTVDVFTTSDQYVWDSSTVYGQSIVDALEAEGLTPRGMMHDWEEVTTSYSTLQAYYENDPRFDNEDPDINPTHKYYQNMASISDARLALLEGLSSSWCSLDNHYDLQTNLYSQYQSGTSRAETAYGRRRTGASIYAFYGSSNTSVECDFYWLGYLMSFWAGRGVHLVNAWVSPNVRTSVYVPGDLTEEQIYDPPTDSRTLTIGEMIAMVKACYAAGSPYIWFYNQQYSATHAWYSEIIALAEMQPYHAFIKYGNNYVPPYETSRLYYKNTTIYYDKDYYGNNLDGIWINCRTYGLKMMFYGFTTSQSDSVRYVKAPTGQKVAVSVSPIGAVTII